MCFFHQSVLQHYRWSSSTILPRRKSAPVWCAASLVQLNSGQTEYAECTYSSRKKEEQARRHACVQSFKCKRVCSRQRRVHITAHPRNPGLPCCSCTQDFKHAAAIWHTVTYLSFPQLHNTMAALAAAWRFEVVLRTKISVIEAFLLTLKLLMTHSKHIAI